MAGSGEQAGGGALLTTTTRSVLAGAVALALGLGLPLGWLQAQATAIEIAQGTSWAGARLPFEVLGLTCWSMLLHVVALFAVAALFGLPAALLGLAERTRCWVPPIAFGCACFGVLGLPIAWMVEAPIRSLLPPSSTALAGLLASSLAVVIGLLGVLAWSCLHWQLEQPWTRWLAAAATAAPLAASCVIMTNGAGGPDLKSHWTIPLGLLSFVGCAVLARLTLGTAWRRQLPALGGILLLGCLIGWPSFGWHADEIESEWSGPSVLLVSIDTLRADALSLHGSDVPTPHLDRLASESIVFEQAHASSPWTLPSVASMLTSRHPGELGMRLGGGRRGLKLRRAFPTLPEQLDGKLRTHAILTNVLGWKHAGFWRGFDTAQHADVGAFHPYEYLLRTAVLTDLLCSDSADEPGGRRAFPRFGTAERVVVQASDWIAERGDEKHLLWLHLLDVHAPYRPLPPHDEPMPHYEGALRDSLGMMTEMRKGRFLEPADRDYIRAAYLAEVQYVDHWLGSLFDELRASGRWDDTLVIVTSDHGEEFWDEDGVDHGHSLRQELIRVPLIVKLPGGAQAGRRVDQLVSLVDLKPTLLDLLDLPPGSDELRGRSLRPLIEGRELPPAPVFAEGLSFFGEKRAVIRSDPDGTWKFVSSMHPRFGEHDALYELRSDPRESRDLWTADGERERSLLDALATLPPPPLDNESSPETLERLRALGYVE